MNITTLTSEQQTEAHQNALARLRSRCDELVAANGPTMRQIHEIQNKEPRKKPNAKVDAK